MNNYIIPTKRSINGEFWGKVDKSKRDSW